MRVSTTSVGRPVGFGFAVWYGRPRYDSPCDAEKVVELGPGHISTVTVLRCTVNSRCTISKRSTYNLESGGRTDIVYRSGGGTPRVGWVPETMLETGLASPTPERPVESW